MHQPLHQPLNHQLLSFKTLTLTALLAASLLACSPKTSKESTSDTDKVSDTAKADAKADAKAAQVAKLTVTLPTIPNGSTIPAEHSFCVEDGKGKGTFGPNKSPEITWEGAPKGTQSFALIAVDPHVPSKADKVNKDGESVSKDLPRVNFYHWLLADIPATTHSIAANVESDKVVPRGKASEKTAYGVRGQNNYSDWFASHKEMSGQYAGYDGPCPPWNDEIVHEYHFDVYALDVPSLNLKPGFKAPELIKAMQGHILAQGKSIGLYKLNTQVKY